MTQLDLQQKLEQAEHREQSAASAAVLLAEKVAEVKAERDALQRQVKDLQDKADFKQNLTEQVVALQQQVNALAAENLALKDLQPSQAMIAAAHAELEDYDNIHLDDDCIVFMWQAMRGKQKTPATDAIKRQWMAEGLDWMSKKAGPELPKTQEMCEHFANKLRQPEEKGHE